MAEHLCTEAPCPNCHPELWKVKNACDKLRTEIEVTECERNSAQTEAAEQRGRALRAEEELARLRAETLKVLRAVGGATPFGTWIHEVRAPFDTLLAKLEE